MLRRIPLSLIVFISTALLLSACGKKKESVAPPGDTTPPSVVATYPEDGQTDVSVTDSLLVVLSEPVICSSMGTSIISLSPAVSGLSVCWEDSILFTPSEDLAYNTTYTVTLSQSLQDENGNEPADDFQWSFTTENEDPGISWNVHQLVLSNPLRDISCSGEIYVAVGIGGQVLRSSDGDSWEEISTPAFDDLHRVVWADTIFIAVGSSEFIMTSPDGIVWTQRRTGHAARSLHDVVFTGDLYVAVGGHFVTGGSMLADVRTSPDAITWNPEYVDQTGSMNSIVWTGTRFIATGFQVPGMYAIWTSENGQDWVLSHMTAASAAHYEDVDWSGNVAIATGFDPSQLLFSPDGLQWNNRVLANNHQTRAIEWTGSQFVAVGHFGNIFTSPDGNIWTSRKSGINADLFGVWGSPDKIVAVGESIILTSP